MGKQTRLMRPSVDGMTVQQERACLSEIRTIGMQIDPHHVLHNGMLAGDFALKYISGHHKKRQEKHQRKLMIDPTSGKMNLIEPETR